MIDADYISPDGLLRFIVRSPDGDVTMGFDGYPWHTHGDMLPGNVSTSIESRTKSFVDALLDNRAIIAVLKDRNVIKDIWITDDLARAVRYPIEGESIEFRLWGGTRVETQPPI
jgi:hypothetical protein